MRYKFGRELNIHMVLVSQTGWEWVPRACWVIHICIVLHGQAKGHARRLGCQCSLGWYLPCFPLNSKFEFWVTFTQKLELQRAEKRFGADISLAAFSIQNLSKFHSQTSGSWKQTRVGYFAQTQGTSEGDGWDGQGIQEGVWFYINHVCWIMYSKWILILYESCMPNDAEN